MLHRTTVRVRFGETDMAGHVNNAVYMTDLAEARLNFLRELLALKDVPLILAACRINFLRQVRYPELIRIDTGACRLGTKSFDLAHWIWRTDTPEVALTAVTTLVYFDYAQQTAMPLPVWWRQKLSNFFVDAPSDPYAR